MQWKIVDRFPEYEVSEFGDVKRIKTGRILKPTSNCGYSAYTLIDRGKRQKTVRVHSIVALAFIGPKPFEKAEVCHDDGVKANNDYRNLRWDSSQGNANDRVRHGTSSKKLRTDKAIQIKAMVAEGRKLRDVADLFGVAPTTVWSIANGQKWKHIS